MILIDSDVAIDLWRQHRPASEWFSSMAESEVVAISGFSAMELVQGCRNKMEQRELSRFVDGFRLAWLSETGCGRALDLTYRYRVSHGLGLIDSLIAQTAMELGLPLHTFNVKHYRPLRNLRTIQAYDR